MCSVQLIFSMVYTIPSFRCLVLIIVNRDLSSSSSFNTSFDMYVLCPTDLLDPTPYLHFKGFQSCDVLLSHSPHFCTVQGHTSNQCFHHYFLDAFSFFSILPLVILFSGKRLLSHCYPGGQSWGLRVATSRFWAGGSREGRGGSLESWAGREILLYLIMYRKYVRKWLLLKR